MGYQIKYQTSGKIQVKNKRERNTLFLILSIAVAVIISLLIWENRAQWQSAVIALDKMVVELEQGSPLQDAFTVFCLQVLHGV